MTCGEVMTSLANDCAAINVAALMVAINGGNGKLVVRSRIVRSASRDGVGTSILAMKRSSCASGSGCVPSCSIGFCVAKTKNGFSSAYVFPPTLTERSCIASNKADCVLGVARFSSSAKRICVKTGPGRNRCSRRPCWRSSTNTVVPNTSAGIKSGVH